MVRKKVVEKVRPRGKRKRAAKARIFVPKQAKTARVEAAEVRQRTGELAPLNEHAPRQAIAHDRLLSAQGADVYQRALGVALEVYQALFALSLQGLRMWQTAWISFSR